MSMTLSALVAFSAVASAPTSGLNVGQRISAYYPTHVVGSLRGTQVCFPCTYKSAPQIQVFTNNEKPENVNAIARHLDGLMRANPGFYAMVVVVKPQTDHAKKTETLRGLFSDLRPANVTVSLLDPKDEAIKAYGINLDRAVTNTVIGYEGWMVQGTAVNLQATPEGLKALDAMVAKMMK
jgi:hypothetical protein